MANKRSLKKKINDICSILYAKCCTLEHLEEEAQITEVKGIIKGILFLQDKMLTICNKAPRRNGKAYFQKNLSYFKEKVLELSEQLDTL